MKIITYLYLALLLTSCGPATTNSTESQSTTKTTTTVTTTVPVVPAAPIIPPMLTQANLDRIQNDMSATEVETILGQPTSSQTQPIPLVGGTQTTYNYQNGASAVTIVFKNNQVKEKSGTFAP